MNRLLRVRVDIDPSARGSVARRADAALAIFGPQPCEMIIAMRTGCDDEIAMLRSEAAQR
jgi:hypothetical protein